MTALIITAASIAGIAAAVFWLKSTAHPNYESEEYTRVADQWHPNHGPSRR